VLNTTYEGFFNLWKALCLVVDPSARKRESVASEVEEGTRGN
jgi:hypothetical protein